MSNALQICVVSGLIADLIAFDRVLGYVYKKQFILAIFYQRKSHIRNALKAKKKYK